MKAFIGALVSGGLAISALALGAEQASAETLSGCHAPSGRSCVAVENDSGYRIGSVRVNGRCLHFASSNKQHAFPDTIISSDLNAQPSVSVYSGGWCESNTGFKDKKITTWTAYQVNGYRLVGV